MSEIDICLASERRQWIALLENDDGTPDFFDDLSRRTAALGQNRLGIFWPRWNANSAFTPSCGVNWGANLYDLPAGLLDEWRVYSERWEHLLDLNPRMRIADCMSDVSEDHDACSFPYGYEISVRDWVRSEMTIKPSFYLGDRSKPQVWREQFLSAAEKAGRGWVYAGGVNEVIYHWIWDDDTARLARHQEQYDE